MWLLEKRSGTIAKKSGDVRLWNGEEVPQGGAFDAFKNSIFVLRFPGVK